MARERDLGMKQAELEAKIDKYFKGNKTPTVSGLCLALDITVERFSEIVDAYGKDKDLKDVDIQPGHAKLLYKARLQMADKLEQTNTTRSFFLLKQPVYAGYKDKQETTFSGEAKIKIEIGGMKKRENAFE